jgi:hypothetical protein
VVLLFGSDQPLAFCAVCGYFAELNIKALKVPCPGPVCASADPSRGYRLAKMATGRHPLRKVWASDTRRVAFGSLAPLVVSSPSVAGTCGGPSAVSPVVLAAGSSAVVESAALCRLGLPCVTGTGCIDLDELFMLECEAGFAESSGLLEPDDEGDVFGFDSG